MNIYIYIYTICILCGSSLVEVSWNQQLIRGYTYNIYIYIIYNVFIEAQMILTYSTD